MANMTMANPYAHTHYTIKRPFFTLFGRKFYVYSPDGTMVMYVEHAIFSWKDKWFVYADEAKTMPLISVEARKAIAIDNVHDIVDARTGQKIGAVRSKGWKSVLSDTWELLDANDQPWGMQREDSSALLRRFIPWLLGRWHAEVNGQEIARIQQVFRFFAKEFTLDTSMSNGSFDPRFAIVCALLALMKEINREG